MRLVDQETVLGEALKHVAGQRSGFIDKANEQQIVDQPVQ